MTAKRYFYILLGVLVVSVGLAGFGYYYATTLLSTGIHTLAERRGDQQVAETQVSDLNDLQNQYNRLGPLMPVIDSALPKQKDQTKIAIQLRNIAASSGMDLNSLDFTASSAPGPTSQTIKVGDVLATPITFELSGTYPQLQAFLQKQEHLDRYTDITALNIEGGSVSGDLKFSITLNAYIKP